MYDQLFPSISPKWKILTNFILCFSSGLIVPPGPICAITDLKVFSNYEKRGEKTCSQIIQYPPKGHLSKDETKTL